MAEDDPAILWTMSVALGRVGKAFQEVMQRVDKIETDLRDEIAALREEFRASLSAQEPRLRVDLFGHHSTRNEVRSVEGNHPAPQSLEVRMEPEGKSDNGTGFHLGGSPAAKAGASPSPLDSVDVDFGRSWTSLSQDTSPLVDQRLVALQMQLRRLPLQFRVGQYNLLAGYLGRNMEPWFLYGANLSQERRERISRLHSERDSEGRHVNVGWPNYVRGVLSPEEEAEVERVDREIFDWDKRKFRLLDVIKNMDADILSLVECDHYEDHFKPGLAKLGYDSIWKKRPRRSSHDGCCIAWRPVMFELLASTHVEYIDRYDDQKATHVKDRIALVALLRANLTGETICFVSTHLARNPENSSRDRLRARQIGQVMRVLADFVHEHRAYNACVTFAGDLNICSFARLRGIAMSVALLRKDNYVHPFVFDCNDIPTGVTSVTTSRNVRIDAILYEKCRLDLIDTDELPELDKEGPIPNTSHPSDHVPIVGTFRVRTRMQIDKEAAREWYLRLAGRHSQLPLDYKKLKNAFLFYDHDGCGRISAREFKDGIKKVLGAGVSSAPELSKVMSMMPDEGLSLEAFVLAYRQALVKEGMPGMDYFNEAFEAFDSQNDGHVDITDTLRLFAECCPAEVPEQELREAFKAMDTNGNGQVNISEFREHLGMVWATTFIDQQS